MQNDLQIIYRLEGTCSPPLQHVFRHAQLLNSSAFDTDFRISIYVDHSEQHDEILICINTEFAEVL